MATIITPVTRRSSYYRQTGNVVNIQTTQDDTVGSELITRSTNANFRNSIAAHTDAGTAYSRQSLESYDSAMFSNTVKDYLGRYDTIEQRVVNPLFGFAPQRDSVLRDIALKHLKRKLSTSQNEFKALVPIAESRDLARTIHSTADIANKFLKTIAHPRRALTKANWADAKKFASDAWLTFSFGISPAIADAQGLASTIADTMSKRGEDGAMSRYVGVASSISKQKSTWQTSYSLADTSLVNCSASILYKTSYLFGAGVYTRPRSANAALLSQQFGLDIGEVVPAAWELIPYSWLIDYFTTTGDFLSDVFSGDGGNTSYTWENFLCEYELMDPVITYVPPLGNRKTVDLNITMPKASGYFFERIPLGGSLPHRSFRIKTLDEIGVNSVKRLLNLTSLLVGRDKSVHRPGV